MSTQDAPKPRKKYDVFISYSHQDEALVKPLVEIMGLNRRRVFWDRNSLHPGDDWNETILRAIAATDLLVVLWCCDTAKSEWVAREIREAERLEKKIVPIRLCDYPLNESISRFQWIDAMRTIRHTCGHMQVVLGTGDLPSSRLNKPSDIRPSDIRPSDIRPRHWARQPGVAATLLVTILCLGFVAVRVPPTLLIHDGILIVAWAIFALVAGRLITRARANFIDDLPKSSFPMSTFPEHEQDPRAEVCGITTYDDETLRLILKGLQQGRDR